MTPPRPLFRCFVPALAACLFLLVLGAKWATFDQFGSAMPDWDQWDAEALELFVPWFEHDHFVAHLFTPHNEHRVIATKLQNLALVLLNGQWDARLESVTNAMLHSAIAVAFWLVGRRWLATRWQAPLFGLIAALFGLPLAWQNILGGFHSQQYWLLGFSFAAIAVLPFARPGSARWWGAALAAVFALGSMGSGFLAAVVVAGVVGFRLWRRETTLREAWPTLALTALLIGIGAATRVEVAYHQELKAKTVHDFVFSILRSMEWPLRDHDWIGAVLWLPWIVALGRTWRTRDQAEGRAGQTIAALGGWVLVQFLATAYARGAGADYPASRYMDTPAFGVVVNAVALGWLLSGPISNAGPGLRLETSRNREVSPTARPVARRVLYVFGLVWLVTLGLGLRDVVERNLRTELPDAKSYYLKAEEHLRGFLATNDRANLAFPDIPFPNADGLAERLDHPVLRALLPAVIRNPLPLPPAQNGGAAPAAARASSSATPATRGDVPAAFRENDVSALAIEPTPRHGLSPATPPLISRRTWGSFGGDGAATTGEWKSSPITSTGGWLKFETAGQIGEPGVALELRDAETGALLATVRPTKIPGDSWRAAYVRTPGRPFVVVARDTDAQRWLAFSAPVEMGTLSYWAWQAVRNGRLIAELAALAAALLGLAALVVRRWTPA